MRLVLLNKLITMTRKSTIDKDDNLNNPRKPAEPNKEGLITNGLDEWNKRLDNNLEGEHAGDPQADENAKFYSERFNSEETPLAPTNPGSNPDS